MAPGKKKELSPPDPRLYYSWATLASCCQYIKSWMARGYLFYTSVHLGGIMSSDISPVHAFRVDRQKEPPPLTPSTAAVFGQ